MASGNNSKKSDTWIKSLSERILPFRAYLGALLLMASWPGLIPAIPTTEPTIECIIPDICHSGYAPSEVLNWYEFIGADGRLQYLYVVAFDSFILIPLYSSVLFLELNLALPNPLSDTIVSCLPFLATVFDLVETTTHGFAVAVLSLGHRSLLPSEAWLGLVSLCTRVKFLVLGVTMMALVFCRAFKLLSHFTKRKQQ